MGQQIAISVCTITEGSGPSKLERRDKTASVTVQGQNIEFRLELLYTMARKTRQLENLQA
jgi:hypothetical protein